jgi:hypothetical protein
MSISGEAQKQGTRMVETMPQSKIVEAPEPLPNAQTIDHLKLMYSMLHTPLEINVACENIECKALLKVSVPDSVSRLAPPNLVIRCAGCTKLLSVSLPEETYIQHQIQRLETIRNRQKQMEQMRLLTAEVQRQKSEIEKQMDALINRDNTWSTPKEPGGLQQERKVSGNHELETPDAPHDLVQRRDT